MLLINYLKNWKIPKILMQNSGISPGPVFTLGISTTACISYLQNPSGASPS